MARTKAEIRAFLDSKVGTVVPEKTVPDLNGQCVTLIKALMEFLGVPNPYAARGNAKDAGDTYTRQGIGTPGRGWLTIVVNRDMGLIGGVRYGHIWVDLMGEANYESNGARALVTTKGTRPLTQGQQFINFDKWVKEDSKMPALVDDSIKTQIRIVSSEVKGWNRAEVHSGKFDEREINAWRGQTVQKFLQQAWEEGQWYRDLKDKHERFYKQYSGVIAELSARPSRAELQAALDKLASSAKQVEDANARALAAEKDAQEAAAVAEKLIADKQRADETGNAFMRWIGDQLNKILGGK